MHFHLTHTPRDYAKTYATILLGSLIFAFSLSFFFDPLAIPSGGVSGVALLINHFFPTWDTGVLYFLFNIPLLLLALFALGLEFSIATVYATFLCSLFTALFDWLIVRYGLVVTENRILGALAAGALMGVGLGLIFRMRASSGGSDIVVKLLRKKFRHIKSGVISMTIDVFIISLSCLLKQDSETLLYGILQLLVLMFVFDYVLYANNSAKLTFIITTQEFSQAIIARIMKDIDTGATVVDGKGAYTGNDKVVILCACKPVLFPKLRDIVTQEDKRAFLIVSSAQEIYGENFQEKVEDL